jgi:O-antigen ligase
VRASGDGNGWDLYLITAAALILVSVARLHAFVPGLAVVRPALVISLVGLGCLLTKQQGARRFHHLKGPLATLMVAFVACAILGVPFGIYGTNSAMFLSDQFLREAIVILVIVSSVRDVTDLKRLLAVFGFGAIAFAVMATGSGGRAVGGGGYDANDSAMFVASGTPLVFYFLVRSKTIIGKVLFGLGLAACGSCVVVSGSRGGFLALVAVLGYSLFFLKGIRPSVRTAVVAVAALVVVSQANADFWDRIGTITDENDYNRVSYTGRQQVWTRGVGYMLDRPIFGVGIDNFTVAEGRHPEAVAMLARGRGIKFSAAHSIWIQLGAELGFPGLLLFLAVLWRAFKELRKADGLLKRRGSLRDPELEQLGELGRPLIGVMLGMLVAGTFLSRVYSSLVWMPLGLAWAVVKVASLRQQDIGRVSRRRRLGSGRPPPALSGPRSRPGVIRST